MKFVYALLAVLAAAVLASPAPAAVSTTGPVPPQAAGRADESIVTALLGDALGEVVIPVPGYKWHDGCGPTAVGMVVGYYAAQYPNLVRGDPDAMMASAGHYADYVLPMDTGYPYPPAPDKSELPEGDEHPSDSVADFMHTSFSYYYLFYGQSATNMGVPAFTDYVSSVYPGVAASGVTYYSTKLTWPIVTAELDAARPMVFGVDSDGDGACDHFVTVIGYRDTSGYPEYCCWDTWSTTLVRWERFRPLSAAYPWGVWGGYSYAIGGAADTTPPVTTVSHGKKGAYYLTATDSGSGVYRTYYRVSTEWWIMGDSFRLTKGTAYFYSTDNAGNVEQTKSVTR